jgi:hypothetical protein
MRRNRGTDNRGGEGGRVGTAVAGPTRFSDISDVSLLLTFPVAASNQGGRIMQTLVLYGVFAASFAYVSPLAAGKWQSRAIGVVMLCLVATAGALAMTTDQ